MKKTALTLILFFLLTTLFAQEWAPVGATWCYNSNDPMNGYYWYAIIKSEGDTVIQGKNCKVLQSNGIGTCTYGSAFHPLFIYSDTNKVFYFNQNINKFYLLYDFNKLPGDTFYIPFMCAYPNHIDSIGFIIDSISSITIGSNVLKVQFVTAIYNYSVPYIGQSGKII
jgi:hypothetical protein